MVNKRVNQLFNKYQQNSKNPKVMDSESRNKLTKEHWNSVKNWPDQSSLICGIFPILIKDSITKPIENEKNSLIESTKVTPKFSASIEPETSLSNYKEVLTYDIKSHKK